MYGLNELWKPFFFLNKISFRGGLDPFYTGLFGGLNIICPELLLDLLLNWCDISQTAELLPGSLEVRKMSTQLIKTN